MAKKNDKSAPDTAPEPKAGNGKQTIEHWAKEQLGLDCDHFGIPAIKPTKNNSKLACNRALYMGARAKFKWAVGHPMTKAEFDTAVEDAANTRFGG